MAVKQMTLGNLGFEISGSRTAALTAAGMGAVAVGSLSLLLAKSAGVPPGLAALGGAVLGGIGAFAAVAHPRFIDNVPEEDEDKGIADTVPGGWDAARIVSYLQEHLGQDVTAYVSGIKPEQKEVVDQWASGEIRPEPLVLGRLRAAYGATHWILKLYDGETAQAWFFGMNQWFDDEAPAYVLRYSSEPKVWEEVVDAAQAFMGS